MRPKYGSGTIATLTACISLLGPASGTGHAAACPVIARGVDSAGHGPLITAQCLPKLSYEFHDSAGISGMDSSETTATFELEPRITDKPVSLASGYDVAFYPGSGSWQGRDDWTFCANSGSGAVTDAFDDGYKASVLYHQWGWLSDPFWYGDSTGTELA